MKTNIKIDDLRTIFSINNSLRYKLCLSYFLNELYSTSIPY